MIDGFLMIFLKIYLACMSVILVVDTAGFLIRVNQINDFTQHVNYQIQRNGGLNENALKQIEKKNKEAYGGSFQIQSDSLNKTLPFGSEVTYEIKTIYVSQVFGIKTEMGAKGGALSLIR
ncbi:hypothetical protein [Bacillus sp. FSL W8-0502]|uniref:hypothetical protein n=1 Tax=Bacillus sp. FSL W8-0502 TaxID=2954622 RepID=UPI0031581F80